MLPKMRDDWICDDGNSAVAILITELPDRNCTD
jgi:hypothetical protein